MTKEQEHVELDRTIWTIAEIFVAVIVYLTNV